MANSTLAHITRYFQSANADAQTIKEDFLLRTTEFDIIMGDIRNNPMRGSVQHYLLTGRRGSGKSTLLKRIQIEIEEDEQLNKEFVPINLAEEQANIFRLYDLLLEITQELEEKGIEVHMPDEEDDCNTYSRRLFATIHEAIEQSGKKIILLLDNIDRIFDNLREDSSLLREMLLNYDDIKIIGGSTKMSEHFWEYNKPFYQFFRELPLQKLTSDEVKKLLLHWSEKPGNEELKNFIANRQGQIEMVRQLTDGLPRTLQFFVKILIGNDTESGYEYMRQIMDIVTPLYQERLNGLPAAQRKIVLQMAFIWEAAGAKDIAAITNIPTSNVSGQLKQLIEKGITEKVDTGTKNHLYRLSERFFNLWLIFTQGSPKEKRRARYLTIFMENFYDGDGLRDMAAKHLNMLRSRQLAPNKAILLTKALAQSRFVDSSVRDSMITHTIELNGVTENMKEHLPQTIARLEDDINKLIENRQWNKALKIAECIEQEDGVRELLLGNIHLCAREYEKALQVYNVALSRGVKEVLGNLGIVYFELSKFDLAEQFYLEAIDAGSKTSLYNIGIMYMEQSKHSNAIKYLQYSIENDFNKGSASFYLANIYSEGRDYEQAEKYYRIAIVNDHSEAFLALGNMFATIGKAEDAESFLLKAREKGFAIANLYIAMLYYVQNIKKEAALQHLEAVPETSAQIAINAWHGNIEKSVDLLQKLLPKKDELLDWVLENLLYHHQTNIVYNVFQDSEFGIELQERFEPLYYASIILSKKSPDINLRIPPEVQETVNILLSQIKDMQEFYYGNKK